MNNLLGNVLGEINLSDDIDESEAVEVSAEEFLTGISEEDETDDVEIDEEDATTSNTDGDEDDPEDIDENEDTNKNSSMLSIVAKALSERGIVSLSEEQLAKYNDIQDAEGAEEFFDDLGVNYTSSLQEAVDTRVSNELQNINDDPNISNIVKNYKAGVPLDKIINNISDTSFLETVNDETIEDEDIATKVLLLSGKTEDEIVEYVDIVKMAKKVLPIVVEAKQKEISDIKAKNKNIALDNETAAIESRKAFSKAVDDTDEILPNSKIPKSLKKKMKSLVLDSNVEYNGERTTELNKYILENGDAAYKFMAYAYAVTEGFTKMDAFGKVYTSKANKDLGRLIKAEDKSRVTGSKGNTNSDMSISDEADAFFNS